MEKWKKRAVELISNLTLEYKSRPGVIEYTPQKTEIFERELPSLPRTFPENVGISPARLSELISRLEEESRANVHSLMIVKGGEVVLEVASPGYSQNVPHLSHSMSKTVIGIALGLLVDDKKINTGIPLSDFFDKSELHGAPDKLTVEHLLTMSSGASFAEGGSVSETRWTEGFFSSSFSFSPGSKFSYNSMNSYIIAVICDRVVRREYGITLEQFLDMRLFSPLDIKNYFWEKSPEGIIKGGWGLYMSAESWAKLGMMMLEYGRYNGVQILSERWVIEATSTKIITPDETGDFNYGYQLWVSRKGEDFLFNGMLGQNVWVCPRNNLVAVVNSGNNELFQKSPALEIITDVLGGSLAAPFQKRRRDSALLREKVHSFFQCRRWVHPREPMRGLPYILGIKNRRPFPEVFSSLYGEYTFPKNNVGILPVFVRIMQNNYLGGIGSLSISRRRDLLRLSVKEGNTYYNIDVGFYEAVANDVDFGGEKYRVLACADYLQDTRGAVEYRIELVFPELPNTRRITLSLSADERLSVKMTEIPDKKITESFVRSIPAMAPKIRRLVDLLERELGRDFIDTKLTELFSPELVAIKTTAEDYKLALDIENAKIERKIAASKLIRSLVDKFTAIDGEGDESESKSPSIGTIIFSSLLGKIFPRSKYEDPDNE